MILIMIIETIVCSHLPRKNQIARTDYCIAPYGTRMICFMSTALSCVIPFSSPSSLK